MHISELETPAVAIDVDILERNLATMAAYVQEHGFGLRPHTKTHKIEAIARMQLRHGSMGLTVAKSEEAVVMAHAGCTDILVAYPVYGPAKWERLAHLARDRRITVAVDSLLPAEGLAGEAVRAGSTIGLLVEFDVGMHRCGVPNAEAALALAQQITRLPGVEMRGLMYYPGHIWDRPEAQAPALAHVEAQLAAVLDALRRAGISAPIVSGGSTPTARNSHLVQGTTEIRPGTYVFNDRNTLGVGACAPEDIAVRVLATVVSASVPGRAIVDSGSKTLTTDRWISGNDQGFGSIDGYPDMKLVGLSEEHGHLDLSRSANTPRAGERVAVVPNHVCPCINLHDRVYFHSQGEVLGSWEVDARGRIR